MGQKYISSFTSRITRESTGIKNYPLQMQEKIIIIQKCDTKSKQICEIIIAPTELDLEGYYFQSILAIKIKQFWTKTTQSINERTHK